MSKISRLLCSCGTFLLLATSAQAGSIFTYILSPSLAPDVAGTTVSVDLKLRENFDGVGSAVLATGGQGLFSFATSLTTSSTTSGTPATIESVALSPAFEPIVSGHSIAPGGGSALLNAAIHPITGTPIFAGPAMGAGAYDITLATLMLKTSSVVDDLTTFSSASHSSSAIFETLHGTGSPIAVTFGPAGQVESLVPEPASYGMILIGALSFMGVRRRQR